MTTVPVIVGPATVVGSEGIPVTLGVVVDVLEVWLPGGVAFLGGSEVALPGGEAFLGGSAVSVP